MELSEFAERVLFATTLEEKLRPPGDVTDERPGVAMDAPKFPGRPEALRFKPSRTGREDSPFRGLENERARGRLLHFFANHELLATELMALVLLRFPEAPSEFRRGVLRTLAEEQEHTRLYVQRMGECGVAFGEHPVSGFFWRCVAPMENPIDYVAGLSLTFEQANLDFARHFSMEFAKAGDADTAGLLERIHRDEIGHVAHGLKWFRRWKDARLTDWEAFCRQLKFPLTPKRAKGFAVNAEARRAAGFDATFIAELSVHEQSKGRTPTVWYFNPFAESFIAQGRAFTPTAAQASLARDLATLPQFLARQDDVVLVPKRPAVEFLQTLQEAGFPPPEFVAWEERTNPCLRALAGRKLGALRPWAWSPDSVALLEPLFPAVSRGQRGAEQQFNPRIAQLYSKAWSAELLRKFLDSLACSRDKEGNSTARFADGENPLTFLCTPEEVGISVQTSRDALEAIAAIRNRGHHRIVVKQALGRAGSNALRLWEPALLDTQRRWMETAFERGETLVVEPWLERLRDFSAQLEMTTRGLRFVGYTGLFNDARGQFLANSVGPQSRRLPLEVTDAFPSTARFAPRIQECFHKLFQLLEEELRRAEFLGPLGIDAFVYRAADERIRLKPLVELNPRYTMGRVTLELMTCAAPGSHGMFQLINRAQLRTAGFADFASLAQNLRAKFPLQLIGEPIPKIREGIVCLNDPAAASVVLALFRVSNAPMPALFIPA